MTDSRILSEAENGNSFAQLRLGKQYWHGENIRKNRRLALSWFEKAAQGGQAIAYMYLSFAYRDGIHVPKDEMRAYELAKRATKCKFLDSAALMLLGWMSLRGIGTSKDIRKARTHLVESVDLGCARGAFFLGIIEEEQKSWEKAAHWFFVSAEMGYPDGMYRAGRLLVKRSPHASDFQSGKFYLEKAAAAGLDYARRLLLSLEKRKTSQHRPRMNDTWLSVPIGNWVGTWKSIDEDGTELVIVIVKENDSLFVSEKCSDARDKILVSGHRFDRGRLLVNAQNQSANRRLKQTLICYRPNRILLITNNRKDGVTILRNAE